ncbi:hypothetical protein [Roseovarius sp.]|uniref:hypothetical protein n=1 Tax=Roseovarius sp. TaxID=1486281 RepID=UPI0035680F9A
MKTRRQSLMLLGTAALAACSAPALVTRNEYDPFEGGIGGTGIVGTLYGFGSLLINGLRVELDSRTQFRSAFGATSRAALAPGQVLTVFAVQTKERLLARNVMVDYALVGTLEHSQSGASVNGVPLIDRAEALTHGAFGERVAVSGVWTPNGLRPSRIDQASAGPDLIAGTADIAPGGVFSIGSVPIEHAGPTPVQGSFAAAFGRAQSGGFSAERLHSGRFIRRDNLRQLSVEGYLESSRNAPGLRIAGLGHNFTRDARLSAVGNRRAIYFGEYKGLFGARQGFIVPDEFAAREQLLGPGLDAGFSGTIVRI